MLSMLNSSRMAGLSQQMQPFKNMFAMVRNAGNPQAMMSQMMQNNPHYNQAMQIIQQNGGDAKAAFYNLAEQNGVNPDDILSMLR